MIRLIYCLITVEKVILKTLLKYNLNTDFEVFAQSQSIAKKQKKDDKELR